jgi:hypothetical protein
VRKKQGRKEVKYECSKNDIKKYKYYSIKDRKRKELM